MAEFVQGASKGFAFAFTPLGLFVMAIAFLCLVAGKPKR